MSAETDISIRYGFVPQDQAGLLQRPVEENDLRLKLFEEGEDVRWSMGAGIRKALNYNVSAYGATAKNYRDEMYQRILLARGEGKTPFRITGHPDSFPEFLEQTGVVEIEFVV